jgi:hypothetical protein
VTTQTTQISIRLSNETLRQITDLQKSWGENRSQVIIRCIERMWAQHGSLKKAIGEAEVEASDDSQLPIEDRP